MKNVLLLISALSFCSVSFAQDLNLNELGKSYFSAWQATQAPNASKADIEHYLSFLTDDVGHQHIPYDNDDSRYPSAKDDMRNGMAFYLGSHTEYASQLKQITVGYNVIVISYSTSSTGVHPQTKESMSLNYDSMDVLEIEDGKISVIRKYEE